MSGGDCCSEGRCFCIPIRPVHHQSLIVNTGPSDAPVALWANVGLLNRTILCRRCAIKTILYRSEKAGVVDLQPVLELPPKQQEACLVVDWGGAGRFVWSYESIWKQNSQHFLQAMQMVSNAMTAGSRGASTFIYALLLSV